MHVIAAKAVGFLENLQPEFRSYSQQVIKNAKALAEALIKRGFQIISKGTDNHLMLIDLRNKNVTGKQTEEALDQAGITVNKNAVPFDDKSPMITSGIRIGTPAVTTRGMKEPQMETIAGLIEKVVASIEQANVLSGVSKEVMNLCEGFPLYPEVTSE